MRLLQELRSAQRVLADLAASGSATRTSPTPVIDVATFLSNPYKAWHDGEVRATHRTRPGAQHWWRSRVDPFEHTWPLVEQWLESEPTLTGGELMTRLAELVPDAYAGKAQLRTLQRRIKTWRAVKAKALILGALGRRAADQAGAAEAAPAWSKEAETTT